MTTPNDGAEPSSASAGSQNTDMATARLSAANTWLQEEIKRLRLTDEEREAMELAIDSLHGVEDVSDGACARADGAAGTIRKLLERLA